MTITAPPVFSECRLPEASDVRKEIPMCEGLIDYFPDALAYVAHISFKGNQKHNPGQKLHHSRGKSNDHADCIARHLVDRGLKDAEGARHSGYLAWRALALLQEELEKANCLLLPRGARAPEPSTAPMTIEQLRAEQALHRGRPRENNGEG